MLKRICLMGCVLGAMLTGMAGMAAAQVVTADGGVTLAKYMFEDVPHLDVDIHRPSTGWKRKMRSIMRLTRFLPRWIGDELRISEAKRLAKHKPRAIVATPDPVTVHVELTGRWLAYSR